MMIQFEDDCCSTGPAQLFLDRAFVCSDRDLKFIVANNQIIAGGTDTP